MAYVHGASSRRANDVVDRLKAAQEYARKAENDARQLAASILEEAHKKAAQVEQEATERAGQIQEDAYAKAARFLREARKQAAEIEWTATRTVQREPTPAGEPTLYQKLIQERYGRSLR